MLEREKLRAITIPHSGADPGMGTAWEVQDEEVLKLAWKSFAAYDRLATARLSPGLHAWIHGGRRGADPRQAAD